MTPNPRTRNCQLLQLKRSKSTSGIELINAKYIVHLSAIEKCPEWILRNVSYIIHHCLSKCPPDSRSRLAVSAVASGSNLYANRFTLHLDHKLLSYDLLAAKQQIRNLLPFMLLTLSAVVVILR